VQTKVFIVDDHYMVIEGIRSLLHTEPTVEVIGHAMNGTSCHAFLVNQQPDVILMDVNLPDINGIELCRDVKKKYPGIYILGLSTFNQQSFIQKMIDHGASGYVLKNASRNELLEAIQTVANGKSFLSFEVKNLLKIRSNNSMVITRREKEVLELIAEGLTNNEIAQKMFISITTVETHRKNLLEKFSAKNTAELVKLAFQLKFL
jgi:DNA-binding NarL/FixJ family response regulator